MKTTKAKAKPQREIEFTSADEVRTHLVKRRKEMGMSQTEVANKMGVGQSYISMFEAGSRSKAPHLSSLEKYANALDIDLSLVLKDVEQSKGS